VPSAEITSYKTNRLPIGPTGATSCLPTILPDSESSPKQLRSRSFQVRSCYEDGCIASFRSAAHARSARNAGRSAIQPLSAGIPPWAESEDKLSATTIPSRSSFSQLLNKHLLRDGRNSSLQLRETHDSAFLIDSSKRDGREWPSSTGLSKNPEHLFGGVRSTRLSRARGLGQWRLLTLW